MDYAKTICFDKEAAEKLNAKAFSLSKSIFLFAYYDPKPFPKGESKKHQFCTCIVNLYGLLRDCPPTFRECSKRIYSCTSLNDPSAKSKQRRVKKLDEVVEAFRSVFCHNNAIEFPLNAGKVDIVEDWIRNVCCKEIGVRQLKEEHFEVLLDELVRLAEEVVQEMEQTFDSIRSGEMRQKVVGAVIETIVYAYKTNCDYFLNAMAEMYQTFCANNAENLPFPEKLREDTRKWLTGNGIVRFGDHKYTDWLDEKKLERLVKNWKEEWAKHNGCEPAKCQEGPLPSGDFFKILAPDIYAFAINPAMGYRRPSDQKW